MEAYGRGAAWKEAIGKSMSQIEGDARERIRAALSDGIRKLERDPAEFGIGEAAATIGPTTAGMAG